MGCGCNKGRSAAPLPQKTHKVGGNKTTRVATYEVIKDGSVVTTTSSPTSARSEARRVGGSVRVSSRVVEKAVAQ